jgi:hypothetical protein
MAKVKGPLFSVAATGLFYDIIEYRTGSGKSTAHGKRSAPSSRSPAQQAQAALFTMAVTGWRALDANGKLSWKTAATYTGHNGFQLYVSEYQTQNISPPDQPIVP